MILALSIFILLLTVLVIIASEIQESNNETFKVMGEYLEKLEEQNMKLGKRIKELERKIDKE
ncbi:hypothetical protein SAMN05192533_102290 [Mesobacillus persicus]|uniref:Uncharacterized protein n=1 Tax=Mesobacillus persicus TaxID=930146 RepID=A0A1H7XNF8_9BACI|nr:hypothetical protein [Mesobacillus persicus]SEM35306.1 hypothetical protein SAMN05192533_102290 [Mesobacillus persicus]